ncbi:MAG: hypothetical protein ACE5DX_02260 [Candidatus Dojkabacteria bacterium]
MRNTILIVVTTFFFTALFLHVFNNVSPWNTDAVQLAIERYGLETQDNFTEFVDQAMEFGLIWSLIDIKNLLLLLALLGGAVVSGFAVLHLIIDKLFVKKFYEKPNVSVAFRRGVLVYLVIVSLILLRLIAGLFWYNALAVLILAVSIEYAFVNYFKDRGNE